MCSSTVRTIVRLSPIKGGNNVDITVDMDTNVDMGEQETEMP